MSKTLKQLYAELNTAGEAYDTAPEGSDAEEDAWYDYCLANKNYKNKLKEIKDGDT